MDEVFATIKMALISVVIIPLLPNKNYTLLNIPIIKDFFIPNTKTYHFFEQLNVFNPFKIWLLVVFITGISFIGYFLVKLAGRKKGLGLTGLLGGFVSSTAVTVSMSKKSKGTKNIRSFAIAIILASSMMFLRILLEVLVVNRNLLQNLALPLGIMSLTGFVFSSFLFFKKTKKTQEHKVNLKNPFELGTAIKFALFFLLILVVSKSLFILFGNTGIFIASIFAGLSDVDAITLTLSSLALSGTISAKVAILGITLAAATNTLVKAIIARVIGGKKLAKLVMIVFAVILIFGLGIAFII